MNVTPEALATPLLFGSWCLAVAVFTAATVRCAWRRLGQDVRVHAWCAGVFALVALWSVRADVGANPAIHLLGTAAYALVVGPALALVGSALALLAACWLHDGAWLGLGPAYVTTAVVPIVVTYGVTRTARRCLPRHFLVHVFVEGSLGGALSLTAYEVMLFAIGPGGVSPGTSDGTSQAALVACLASGEAMLTGMLLTILLVHDPRSVATLEGEPYARHAKISPLDRLRSGAAAKQEDDQQHRDWNAE